MSAKKAKHPVPNVSSTSDRPAAGSGSSAGATASTAATAPVAWIDSSDPRKRQLARIFLVGVWLYVAALWLLALDQTFDWGIFGPKG